MAQVKQWIEMSPVDTLFFRGSEPMIVGESHEVRTIFPPMPGTISGALITTILTQRRINLQKFVQLSETDQTIALDYPLLGVPGKPNFETTGPVLVLTLNAGKKEFFYPCPANWFAGKGDLGDAEKKRNEVTITISVADAVEGLYEDLGLVGNVDLPVVVESPRSSDLKSLLGFWCNKAALESIPKRHCVVQYVGKVEDYNSGKPSVIKPSGFFENEFRVGIALDAPTRKTRKGCLYSSTHVRLHPRVSMAVGLSEDLIPCHLDNEGVLMLGGEQRLAAYNKLPDFDLPDVGGNRIMALSAFHCGALEKNRWNDCSRCSGPLLRVGGWDMKKRFHKPMTSFFPAGTVIWSPKDSVAPFGFINV
jgi:CRISPR-associated protein Cmr3